MMIWLRTRTFSENALTAVGVDEDVIRREEGARLLTLDAGFAALEEARARLGEERVMMQQQMQEEAQQLYERAHQEGQEQGRQLALEEWYERTLATLADYRHIQKRMRERLAELIASAVEQIVQVEDAKALFVRALSTLDQIIEGASFLTVLVNPKDYAAAQQVFEAFAAEWGRRGQTIKITVRSDKQLAIGSCICESEFGIVDASLQTQIQAMRTALERALGREMSQLEEGEADLLAASSDDDDQSDEMEELGDQQVGAEDGFEHIFATDDGDRMPVYGEEEDSESLSNTAPISEMQTLTEESILGAEEVAMTADSENLGEETAATKTKKKAAAKTSKKSNSKTIPDSEAIESTETNAEPKKKTSSKTKAESPAESNTTAQSRTRKRVKREQVE